VKNILALDLGTDTGWAMNCGSILQAGTWNLASPAEIKQWGLDRMRRRRDPRVTRFFDTLRKVEADCHVDIVVFEDVQFSTYTAQTQLWSSFRSAVWLAFREPIIIECVPVGTLKQFATGSFRATKEMMQRSLFRFAPRWKSATLLNDDAVDALWLWYWAESRLNNIVYSKSEKRISTNS
jgi:Holliday junction resolvasome RuvABC endonuclease subunit